MWNALHWDVYCEGLSENWAKRCRLWDTEDWRALELLDGITITDSKLLELSTFAQVDCGDRAKVGQSKRLHSLLKTELIPFVGIGGGPPALFRVCSFPSLQCGTTLKSSNK